MPILEVNDITKSFGRTEVLKGISFSLERGQALAIIGSSGSGKTTLLRCLNFLETPDTGAIRVNGETLFDAASHAALSDTEIRRSRLHFGMVFQSFNLFPQYTALQNVMLARELLAKKQPDYKANKKRIHDEIETEARAYATKRGFDADKTAETIDAFQALENNGLSDEDGEKLNVLDSYIDEVDEPIAEEKTDAPTTAPTGTATAPNAVNGVVNRV